MFQDVLNKLPIMERIIPLLLTGKRHALHLYIARPCAELISLLLTRRAKILLPVVH